jgi:hypothetical protein
MGVHAIISAQPQLAALNLGWVNQPELLARIQRIENATEPLADEQVLTYLCAYGYALDQAGPQRMARVLLQDDNQLDSGTLWFEFLPLSPRLKEGETHLDLALGNLRKRKGTLSGIEFYPPATGPSWIAVVEAKLKHDISCDVSYDPFRNQLLRVIENAVTLRGTGGKMPERAHVVLLTPMVFRDHRKSRYYGCKFDEYCPSPGTIDTEAIKNDLGRLQLKEVAYPCKIEERLNALTLHWATFEDLISRMQDGEFKSSLLAVARRRGSLLAL